MIIVNIKEINDKYVEKVFLSLFIEPLQRNIIIIIEVNSKNAEKIIIKIRKIVHVVVKCDHLIHIKSKIEQIKVSEDKNKMQYSTHFDEYELQKLQKQQHIHIFII